jgi:multiple antibiotic resistance protein
MHLTSLMSAIVDFGAVIFLTVGALLPIVDPVGNAPIYITMTSELTPEQRRRMAKSVAINSFLLLLASTLVGAYVLDFFGLSIPAVQVTGGVVLFAMGWQMLNSPNTVPALERTDASGYTAEYLSQRAFYPMTMPLTVGPGSISVALALGANPPPGFRSLLATAFAHTIGILIVAVAVYLCDRYAVQLVRKLGPVGTSVVIRLSAFILLCIGVQIFWNGVRGLVVSGFPFLR